MKLPDCEKEIRERHYLIDTELTNTSETHKIKIAALEAYEVKGTGLYYIRCHYYKQIEQGVYGNVLLANKLNDILTHYFAY